MFLDLFIGIAGLVVWEISPLVLNVPGSILDWATLGYSRVDTDVLMEVAYSCNFLAVSDSSTCPDIGTS